MDLLDAALVRIVVRVLVLVLVLALVGVGRCLGCYVAVYASKIYRMWQTFGRVKDLSDVANFRKGRRFMRFIGVAFKSIATTELDFIARPAPVRKTTREH